MKVVIDTDPGTDDAIALIMALNSPELDVQGLTTVGGNARLAHTTRNAMSLLEYLGRPEIPVCKGAARPLVGSFSYGYYYHGPGGLSVRLPPTGREPRSPRAQDAIISLAYSFPGDLRVIALGPLTNVARAIAREPILSEWIKEIVVMGGAVEIPGNVSPHAEFNVYNDPAAAAFVFASGVPVTLIGLDVCDQVRVHRNDTAWASGESTGERLAAEILAGWFALHPDLDHYNLCDPLAIVAAVEPDLLSYRAATVTVETEDPERMGKTSAAFGSGPVRVATTVRAGEALKLISALLRGSSSR